MKIKGVTFMELMIVLIIIGVLSTIGVISNYIGGKENIADKEVMSNLKILQSAEKGYFVEMAGYYPNSGSVSDIPTINPNLSVSLSNNTNRNWNYTVYSTGCVSARRNGGNQRYFNLTITTETDPTSGILCPGS